jgi:hypothetical protein
MLTSNGHDNSLCLLELVNVHNALEAELLEVKPVSLIEVGRDRLGVVVDHDRLLAHLADSARASDSTPIELDRASDTVNTRAKDHSSVLIELKVVRGRVVGRVQVVGVSGVLGSKGVDTLDERGHAKRLAVRTDGSFSLTGKDRNLRVGETSLLGSEHELAVKRLERGVTKSLVDGDNVLELVKEPLVNLGQIVQAVDSVVEVEHGVSDSEQTTVVVSREGSLHILRLPVSLETVEVGVDLADGLLKGLFKSTANSHNLTDRLHGRADGSLDVLELCQIPLGDLGDDVVERRLEASGRGLGDSIRQLGQGVTERDLGGSVSKGVTGGLGGKGTAVSQIYGLVSP